MCTRFGPRKISLKLPANRKRRDCSRNAISLKIRVVSPGLLVRLCCPPPALGT
jgi:hypothetical protein